ncbi:methylated-DNA--[protein]-cysteine S-methyltransferase [Lentibacillus saliphilus]|uniref:methylated-DNA--[protein]-cysteine S-methyltransferase n=1 Tax=Lentibacillus saliphilus TaxID=2737028 RepID=UPI001C2F4FB3|nr:methylated-DNA--[protein]-cysteine S-methyltransferase [Lentibacillus saliphilus]
MTLFYKEMITPIGPLTIVGTHSEIVRIDYGTYQELKSKLNAWGAKHLDKPEFIQQTNEKIAHASGELSGYFAGKSFNFSFPFKYYGTDFEKQVWQALYMTVPYGATRTYKDIAEIIRNPKSVRAVGRAVNKNPFSIAVPCHRIIGKKGDLIGYNGGLDKKKYLLTHEREQMALVTRKTNLT